MELPTYIKGLRNGAPATDALPAKAASLAFAKLLDSQDELKELRSKFIIPTKASLAKTSLSGVVSRNHTASDECVYLIAHGQGLQPRAVERYVAAQLETWALMGVRGHYMELGDSPLRPWQDMAEHCSKKLATVVGALESEVTVMNGLSVNLHLLMATFYKPTEKRHKILTELGPFPSDQYIVESQVKWHGKFQPEESIVKIIPDNKRTETISTEHVLRLIDEHAEDTALVLLPGVHYYTGQLFDIAAITTHCKQYGITVGWDLAHAAGNAELKLHEWGVDFAVWCHYKYLNGGPGSIAGAFVHERHSKQAAADKDVAEQPYLPRLSGWYGSTTETRFNREMQTFTPIAGAAGFQVSNPSAMDLAILSAALSVFCEKPMYEVRSKSLALTAYAEYLLDQILADMQSKNPACAPPFIYLTPRDLRHRAAQLSLEFCSPDLVEVVMKTFENHGVACDFRKSGLLRLTPAPMYTRFEDVWLFSEALRKALGI